MSILHVTMTGAAAFSALSGRPQHFTSTLKNNYYLSLHPDADAHVKYTSRQITYHSRRRTELAAFCPDPLGCASQGRDPTSRRPYITRPVLRCEPHT